VQFLRKHGFMDYSLLVQIDHKNTVSAEPSPTKYKRWNVGPAKKWSLLKNKVKVVSLFAKSVLKQSFEGAHETGEEAREIQEGDVLLDIPRDKGKFVAVSANGHVIHIGIVDFLQRYTLRKRMETFLKGFAYDRKQISCVHPDWYASRMMTAVEAYFT
jgi:hypothetical protein